MSAKRTGHILLILTAGMLSACEKYTGFDYSAGSLGSLVEVSGLITNQFTGDPVKSAEIDFGPQRTFSDSSGWYHIDFILGVDEQRDKPVILAVRADNYFSIERSLIIYPVDTVINIQLEYGAPIIEKIWVGFYEELVIFQTRVRDYQSIENIDRVVSEMHFFKDGETDSRALIQVMQQVELVDTDVAIYQSVAPPGLGDGWTFDLRKFLISAHDLDGFTDALWQRNDEVWSPDTLFTPILLP